MPNRNTCSSGLSNALTKRRPHSSRGQTLAVIAVVLAACLAFPSRGRAFWLLGFSSADTLPPGTFGAIAGTGGQLTSVGDPPKTSYTPFLPHADFRLGIADGFDLGYRLTQVAFPFSGVGPSLGGEIDARYRLTPAESEWQASVVAGIAYSFLEIEGVSKDAWSPGVDLMLSRVLTPTFTFISELRGVYTAIPSAVYGSSGNHLYAVGPDVGMKIALTPMVSLVPEMGVYKFTGTLANRSANGVGFQYGAVLSFHFSLF